MGLRVLVVDDRPERAAMVERALAAAGHSPAGRIASGAGLPERVAELAPDVVIVDTDRPDRDTLEHVRALNEHSPRPVVVFAEEGGSEAIRAALQAGVSAYVVDGLRPERIEPVVEVAVERFRAYRELAEELARTRDQLAARKDIDRAKGLLMDKRGLSEDAAYRTLRKLAMDRGRPLAQVARDLLALGDLLD